jgi:hypothetical protein
MRGTIRRHAEYNSAIQQIENLRYGSEPTAIPAAEARMSRAIFGQQKAIGRRRGKPFEPRYFLARLLRSIECDRIRATTGI